MARRHKAIMANHKKIMPCRMVPLEDVMASGKIQHPFTGVKNVTHRGNQNAECVSCRKAFSVTRQPRRTMLIYPNPLIPLACSFRICERCYTLHQEGGAARDGMLAAVQAYLEGEDSWQ